MAQRPRLLVCLGLLFVVAVALARTFPFTYVPESRIEVMLATPDEDARNIYLAASRATWRDAPKWFAGPWIYPGLGYYRPVTSVLFLAENRAFGRNFTSYNRVTWLLHAANTALLFLLAVSLFRERRIVRVVYGLIAALIFTTESNSDFYAVVFALGWWPAQNDVLSLTFGLLSLLLLDMSLVRKQRGWLAGSLAAFALAVGCKEMAYALVPVSIALIAYRRGPAREMGAFLGAGLFLWLLRKLVVPNPWGQNYFSYWAARKAVDYASGPLNVLAKSGVTWPIFAAVSLLVIGALGFVRRWKGWVTACLMLATVLLWAQFGPSGGTWALVFQPDGLWVVNVAAYLLGIGLAVRYWKREPALFAIVALACAFVPILQFAGHHYLYWPSAFLALSDACFCACLVRFGRAAFRPDPDRETADQADRRGGAPAS